MKDSTVAGSQIREGEDRAGGFPYAIAISDTAVWVSVLSQHIVLRIYPESNEISSEIIVENGPYPLLVTGEGVWVAQHESRALSLIYVDTNEVSEITELEITPCGLSLEENVILITECETGETVKLNR